MIEKYNSAERNYTFNFRRFKILKKKIKAYLKEKYGEDILRILQNKELKEAFYKHVLGFSGHTDVFNSWRTKDIFEFNLDERVKEVVADTRRYVMENLYKVKN